MIVTLDLDLADDEAHDLETDRALQQLLRRQRDAVKIVAGADDRLFQCIARSREAFETVLISEVGCEYAVRALADRVVTDDFEAFDSEANLLQRVLGKGPVRHANQQRQHYPYACSFSHCY